jgi:hypothetical protein
MQQLAPHTRRAIRAAEKEAEALRSTDWLRRPFIRFSHVGEIAAFPDFANKLAAQVCDLSGGGVDCVIYTRHPNAKKLCSKLLIINFTLDQSSYDRKEWSPPSARIVFSAFNGEIDPDVDINFLEHHRWSHFPPIGTGQICPATHPEASERTCDAVRCSLCFQRPVK